MNAYSEFRIVNSELRTVVLVSRLMITVWEEKLRRRPVEVFHAGVRDG